MSFKRPLIFLNTAVIYVWVVLVTFIFALLAILVSFFSKSGDGVHIVARTWGRSILWMSGIKVSVSGLDRIDPRCPYIYMSNHQSNFDIPVLLGRLPVQFRWLAKAELFKIPIFGRSMRGAGYISIDRSDRRSAFESLGQAARKIRDGTSVLIFPEGTRSRDGSLLPFKKGGFVLALDAGVPIVPMTISGTHGIMRKGGLLIQRCRVNVEIKTPVETTAYTRKTKDALMDCVRAAMLAGSSFEGTGSCDG